MIRVLYIVSTLKKSGPINVLYNIVKYIDRSKVQVNIITLSPETNNSLLMDFSKLGAKIYSLNYSRVKGVLLNYKGIDKLINEIDPDIIHSHGIRGDTICSRLKDRLTFTTLHNFPYDDYPMRYGNIFGRLMANKHLKIISKLDFPISVSNSISEKYKNKGLKTLTIQNGVDKKIFLKATPEKKLKLRKQLNIPLNKNIFVSVGHLSKIKDPLTIIKAFKSSNINQDSVIIFLGDGELFEDCKKMARSEKAIIFAGRVKNVEKYLQAADYFISASTSEGLPNAVLEALSSGLPVCLSDIPSHKEILGICNKAGKVFKSQEPRDLIQKIEMLIAEDYTQLSDFAHQIVSHKLNAELMSMSYLQFYQEQLELRRNTNY